MALAQSRSLIVTSLERPERVVVMRAQSSLLHMLGAKPRPGRVLLPEEDKPGKAHAALLSDACGSASSAPTRTSWAGNVSTMLTRRERADVHHNGVDAKLASPSR